MHRILVLDTILIRTDDNDDIDPELEAQPRQQPKGRLVSQTDVIRFLLEHNHQLGSILDLQADHVAGHALKYATEYLDEESQQQLKQQPAAITIQSQAWIALQKMSTTRASSVAIVGESCISGGKELSFWTCNVLTYLCFSSNY